jgi:PAS domain S-box-containing protein/putative nucleotidyltransferase with HDIG domain
MKTSKAKSSSGKRTSEPGSAKHEQAENTIEEYLLNTLLENVPDYIYFKDIESRFIRTSRAHAKVFGLDDPKDAVGKTDFDFFTEEHARQAYEDEQEIIRTGQPISKEEKETWSDRPPTWGLMLKMPLRDKDGKIIGTFGISKDITARKQVEEKLEQEHNLLRSLIDNIPDYIYVKDTQSRFITANPALVRLMGVSTPEDLLGKTDFDFFPHELAAKYYTNEQAFFKSGQALVEYEEPTIDTTTGKQRWVYTTKVPLRDSNGEIFGLIGIGREITERKRTEDALIEHANELASVYRAAAPLLTIGTNLSDVAEEIAQIMVKEFNLADCGVLLVDEASMELKRIRRAGTFALPPLPPLLLDKPGLTVAAVRTGQIIYAPDVNADPRYIPGTPETQSELAIPLKVGTEVLGVLDLQSPHKNAFDEHTQRLVVAFAERAALALKNAQLYEAVSAELAERHRAEEMLRQRLSELEAVNKVSTALRVAQTLEDMLPRLLDSTLAVMKATQGEIWLYDPAKNELRAAISRGWDEGSGRWPQSPTKPAEGINGYVFTSGQPYIAREFRLAPHLSDTTREHFPPGIGGATIPIRSGELVIGTFTINVALPRELTQSEVHLLTTLSEIAGNAIQRTTLHEQTERRLQHLSALSDIERVITSSFDLHFSLGILLNHIIAQLDIDAADVLLFDSNSLMLECVAERGFHARNINPAQLRLDRGYAGQAILDRQIIKVTNIKEQEDDKFLAMLGAHEGFLSYYAVPLMSKGYTNGVLEIFKRAPLEPDEEWLDFLKTLAGQAAIAIDNVTLFDRLQRSNSELSLAYDATIEGWSHALDLRDKETEGHSLRVTKMTMELARAFDLTDDELVQIRRGALLHDIGKMGIPDAILLKPGPLNDEEWTIMRKHPVFAYEMLAPIHYLRGALDIPYCHHERWDGTGYPRGLKGEEIPLAARLFAVVDVWDALGSKRPYRAAWPNEQLREHIKSLADTHFDPQVVKIFLGSGISMNGRNE